MPDSATAFMEHRDVLFTIAYQMLGSASDAEDVLQDAWLRWSDADHDRVENPRAYLVRAVARTALNRLRTLRRQRETYVGQWLPEPIATSRDVEKDVELAEAVSFAMLIVLESLSPDERAVFVLRDVFGFEYHEVAEAISKSQDAVRQIAHRARKHLRARRTYASVTSDEHDSVSLRFFRAVAEGRIQELMDVLAPGVVLIGDGGGLTNTVLRPIQGREKVLRFIHRVRPPDHKLRFEVGTLNGSPALLIHVGGQLDTVVGTCVREGLVVELYVLRNPLKLKHVKEAVPLSR